MDTQARQLPMCNDREFETVELLVLSLLNYIVVPFFILSWSNFLSASPSVGADYALDPFDPDFAKKAKELTNGGAKVGIEVTGIGAGLDGILDCMARYGRVALLGCTRNKDFTIDYYRKVHGPGITLVGAHTQARPQYESRDGWWTQRDDIKTTLKLTEMGRIKLSDIIDEVHSPVKAPEVYTRLANEKSFPMVQFDWRKL